MGPVFACFLDHRRDAPARRLQNLCALLLGPRLSQPAFEARWQMLLLKHQLQSLEFATWPKLAKRRKWNATEQVRILSEFVEAVPSSDMLAFFVAMSPDAWNQLDDKRKKLFGSEQEFCFRRVVRIVRDRIESAGQLGGLALTFDRNLDQLSVSVDLVRQWIEAEGGPAGRVGPVTFADGFRCPQLQAVSLLAGIARRRQREPLPKSDQPVSSVLLPDLPMDSVFEIWDEGYSARYLGGVEWDSYPSGRRR